MYVKSRLFCFNDDPGWRRTGRQLTRQPYIMLAHGWGHPVSHLTTSRVAFVNLDIREFGLPTIFIHPISSFCFDHILQSIALFFTLSIASKPIFLDKLFWTPPSI